MDRDKVSVINHTQRTDVGAVVATGGAHGQFHPLPFASKTHIHTRGCEQVTCNHDHRAFTLINCQSLPTYVYKLYT